MTTQFEERPATRPMRLRMIAAALHDPDWYSKTGITVLDPRHFNTAEEKHLLNYIKAYYTQYGMLPDEVTLTNEFEGDSLAADLIVDITEVLDNQTAKLQAARDVIEEYAKTQEQWIAIDHLASIYKTGDQAKIVEAANKVIATGSTHAAWNPKSVDPNYIYIPEYLVGDLCAKGWLVIFYGEPKCLKSMLVQDMVVCMGGHINYWLEPAEDNTELKAFDIRPAKILYDDFDNGAQVLEGHLAAAMRGRNLTHIDVHIESFPDFSLMNDNDVDCIIQLLVAQKYNVLVIDHLLNATGLDDENASRMAKAIKNLRRIANATGVLIIAIAHTPKNGTTIRGHGSSSDGADMTYLVERKPDTDVITVTCTNPRHYVPKPFSVLFKYESIADDKRILQSFRMLQLPHEKLETSKTRGKSTDKPDAAITAYTWCKNNCSKLLNLSMTAATDVVMQGCGVGSNNARDAIMRLENEGVFMRDGKKTKILTPGAKFPQPEVLVKETLRGLNGSKPDAKTRLAQRR